MKLYLDSMLWIYYFEGNPAFGPPTQSFVNRMRNGHHEFAASHLILAEVLVLPKREGESFVAANYRRFFFSSAVTLIPFTGDTAERFSDLRSSSRVKPADALHLALAASTGIDYFVTTDSKLHSLKLPGIGRICAPDEVA